MSFFLFPSSRSYSATIKTGIPAEPTSQQGHPGLPCQDGGQARWLAQARDKLVSGFVANSCLPFSQHTSPLHQYRFYSPHPSFPLLPLPPQSIIQSRPLPLTQYSMIPGYHTLVNITLPPPSPFHHYIIPIPSFLYICLSASLFIYLFIYLYNPFLYPCIHP